MLDYKLYGMQKNVQMANRTAYKYLVDKERDVIEAIKEHCVFDHPPRCLHTQKSESESSQQPIITNEDALRNSSGSKSDSKPANDNEIIESLRRENEELKLKIKMLEKTQNSQQNIINHLDSNMIQHPINKIERNLHFYKHI